MWYFKKSSFPWIVKFGTFQSGLIWQPAFGIGCGIKKGQRTWKVAEGEQNTICVFLLLQQLSTVLEQVENTLNNILIGITGKRMSLVLLHPLTTLVDPSTSCCLTVQHDNILTKSLLFVQLLRIDFSGWWTFENGRIEFPPLGPILVFSCSRNICFCPIYLLTRNFARFFANWQKNISYIVAWYYNSVYVCKSNFYVTPNLM